MSMIHTNALGRRVIVERVEFDEDGTKVEKVTREQGDILNVILDNDGRISYTVIFATGKTDEFGAADIQFVGMKRK